ncbi:MAG TPA: DinB family protein [Fimbriimonadaceae bacterium]|nr:DinB family protein [Fimbriimonadaceae bacterium]
MVKDVAPLPGFPEAYGRLLAVLQDTTADWRGELWDDIGAEVVSWRVRPGGQSIGAILLHMMVVELYWFEEFVLGCDIPDELRASVMWDEIDVDAGKWPEAPSQPITWYFERYDEIRARSLETIKSWPADDPVKDFYDQKVSLTWVLGHVIQHEAYHGGQIVMIYDLWKCWGRSSG